MTVAIATAAAANYIPMVRAMAASVRRHHPDIEIVLGTVEGDAVDPRSEAFDVLGLADLGLPDPEDFCRRHTRLEAAIGIKPFVLERVLDAGFDAALYVDADALLLADVSDLLGAVEHHAVTLVPHLAEPLRSADRVERELNILQSGVFNGGVIGVNDSPEGRRFLRWWQQRLYEDCRHAVSEGQHFDQRWLDLAPSYFEDVCFWDDPTIDVAHWNLPEREHVPWRLFHFSGYDPSAPHVLTRYATRLTFVDVPSVISLFDEFREAVLAAGWEQAQARPYLFGRRATLDAAGV